jgi:L-rhamnose isomerase/sugar isomerase
MERQEQKYTLLAQDLQEKGVDIEQVKTALKAQRVETPSWGYGDSGTRFKVFHQPGAARTPYEKFADAAQVHKYTGICPTVAIHIPWDMVDDFEDLQAYAQDLGVAIGAVNPNLFQEEAYKLGSVTNPDPAIRQMAVDHMIDCVEIAETVDSDILSLWFADGTNYPGQDHMRSRKRRMHEALAQVYEALNPQMRMLIEYKFFEPAFYQTDLGDWGMSYTFARNLGPKAQVLVDLGHHPLGTNIEQIVAFLLDEAKLGGFHFNSKKFGDDDLTVGSINPYELFLIYNELVDAERDESTAEAARNVAYMIDQSHNVKNKIEASIQSVMNLQVAYAKCLLVDREGLRAAQLEGRVVDAENHLLDAYRTDVRPLLEQVRIEMNLDPDPLDAFRASGYLENIIQDREDDTVAEAGSGYPGA